MSKATWPAPERNKTPILEVLSRVLPKTWTLLEIASGSGQHAAFFAEKLPGLRYLPSDVDAENLASIRAWVHETRLPNLGEPLELDATSEDWGVGQVDAIFNANMIHIAPWECALGLISGAGRHLRSGGVLVLYGPVRIGDGHTAPSNASFDEGSPGAGPALGASGLGGRRGPRRKGRARVRRARWPCRPTTRLWCSLEGSTAPGTE